MTAQTILKYTVDLNKGLQMTPLAPMLATEDDNAHSFVVSAVRDGEKVSFADAQVRGYFIRPDQVTVPLDGEVDQEGNALVTLKEACYRVQGKFQIAIRVISDDVKAVVFCGDGSIRKTSTDVLIDEENIIPSLDELLSQVAVIEQVIDAANEATQSADEATQRAISAAEKAENAKGDTGATPNLTIGTVETLAPGSSATATITGTPEAPILNLGLPRGTDGQGSVRSVNGQSDVVVLTAADVGAVQSVNGQTDVVVLNASDVGALPESYEAPVLSVNGYTGAVTLTADDVGALSSSGTAAKANKIASDAIRIRSCGQWSGEIEASGYTSTLSITPTAVSGYTFLYPVTYGSNSSYFCCYGLVYNSGKIQLYGRNINSKAITPTVDLIGVYIKN